MKHYIFILSALTATAAVAQNTSSNTSPPPPQVLLCKLVQDSVLRLNCYDNAVSALTSQPVTVPPASKQRSWVIDESEGQPRINAELIGANDMATMVIRCRDNRTSVSINFKAALLSTDNQIRVVYQLEKGKQIEEQWKVAADAKSASPPKPITFIRSLPDNGAVSIQVFADADLLLSETFRLGDVTSVRTKLGSQCVWPDTANTTTQKRIPLPRSSPIKSNQDEDDGEKQSTIPSWLSNILK